MSAQPDHETPEACDCEDACHLCQGWYGPGYTCPCGQEMGHHWPHEDEVA